jgi:hypothetical protein
MDMGGDFTQSFGYVIYFAMDTKFTSNGFAYVFIHSAFSMLWWSTRFYQCASRPVTLMLRSGPEKSRRPTQQDRGSARSFDVMVYDVYTGGNCFASCISKRGYPRMAFISAASFLALHSSFRYLRSLYFIS